MRKILQEDSGILEQETGDALLIDGQGITIKINGVDKSPAIDWSSVKKTEVLSKEADTLEFLIKNYPTKTYIPALNDVVQVYSVTDLIFAGVVVEIDNTVDGLLNYNRIICKDYTHLADQLLVSKTYTSHTVSYIAADIISTYCSGFTSVNVVSSTTTIDSIVFNYITVTAALQKLIQAAGGNFDYYFDYTKDLHFFPSDYSAAPFSITDISANFDWQSLTINTDLSQLRNKVTVRGGITAGTAVTNLKVADGKQVVFFVGYALTSFLAYKALAASPTSFSALTVGADGKDDPTAFDVLYNPDNGLLIFPDASKPAINDVVKYTGTPNFPVIVQLINNTSTTLYGSYEGVVLDKTIVTKTTARNRATAELLKYSLPLITGSFRTRTAGLQAGQTILINSTLRGINDVYKIQRITTSLRTPSEDTPDLMFDVEFISTQNLTMNDVLKRLLITDQTDTITVGTNEIVDTIYSELEFISVEEAVSIGVDIPEAETITLGEATTAQSLNYAVQFCLGVQVPSSTKRQFILNGSVLG